MAEYNSMYFENKEKALEFIGLLMEMGQGEETELYNDINIYNEEGAFIVRWVQIPYNREYGGRFEYVPDDGYVMIERQMPDDTYEYFINEEEYKERLEEWLKENPGWKKNEYGRWYNEEENQKLKEVLGIKD